LLTAKRNHPLPLRALPFDRRIPGWSLIEEKIVAARMYHSAAAEYDDHRNTDKQQR